MMMMMMMWVRRNHRCWGPIIEALQVPNKGRRFGTSVCCLDIFRRLATFQNSGTKGDPSNWEAICRQEAWTQAGGPCTGFLNFSQFAHFAEAQGTIQMRVVPPRFVKSRSTCWSKHFEFSSTGRNAMKRCNCYIFFRVFCWLIFTTATSYHLAAMRGFKGDSIFPAKISNFRIQKRLRTLRVKTLAVSLWLVCFWRRWASPCRWVWNSLEHQGLVGAVGGLPKPCEFFHVFSCWSIRNMFIYMKGSLV